MYGFCALGLQGCLQEAVVNVHGQATTARVPFQGLFIRVTIRDLYGYHNIGALIVRI